MCISPVMGSWARHLLQGYNEEKSLDKNCFRPKVQVYFQEAALLGKKTSLEWIVQNEKSWDGANRDTSRFRTIFKEKKEVR